MSQHQFFMYDPGDGFATFATEAEMLKAADDALRQYQSSAVIDCWPEEVSRLVYGRITHTAKQTNLRGPVSALDPEGFDEAGEYWPGESSYVCDYVFAPIDDAAAPSG